MNHAKSDLSFFGRLSIATACFFRALGDSTFASRVQLLTAPPETPVPPVPAVPAKPGAAAAVVPLTPERVHASGLSVLAMLQRDGRFIDFLQEDLAAYSDADIGATARAVHTGCRQVLAQCLSLAPVLKDAEGTAISVPTGFDANRIRLTGNVVGPGPFKGVLKHHGWVTTAVRFPTTADALDPRVLAPAEVELP